MIPFKLMLWNPLTGAYKFLKSHSCYTIHRDAFGFYVDFSNDYKLLRVVRSLDCYTLVAPHEPYIYSRRLDSWRKIESFNYPHLLWRDYQWSPGTFCGRNLYFTVVSRERISRERSCVIGFDVELETFREIKFPEEVLGGEGFNGSLVVMNGCVHLFVPCHNIDRDFYVPSVDIDLWRMGSGGDGWMKVAGYSGKKNIPVSLTPNCVVRSGKWNVTWVFHKALTKVNVTACSKLKTVYMYDAGTFYDLVRTICVETLVSPNP
ncbi:F-box protein CPR1-like [Bidens hawaiensis]|uniref:F-box protein CPR1-like n=1 Tax=Bidens hawaiensis TaxID=980011 RepID=UPI00404A972F